MRQGQGEMLAMENQISSLSISDVWEKIDLLKRQGTALMDQPASFLIPDQVARDVIVLPSENLPGKKGLSYKEGQARLLHDLASIELQAMELAIRTLIEFREAPLNFRTELLVLAIEESQHLSLCLQAIEKLGFRWGSWPVHVGLWQTVSQEDSLLDRVVIVHRYLEGSGLDAGDTLLRRLSGVPDSPIHQVIKTIVHDEIEHVQFGSYWYREICRMEKIDPSVDFPSRMERLKNNLPSRIEPININLRKAAGFTEEEVTFMQKYRDSLLIKNKNNKK